MHRVLKLVLSFASAFWELYPHQMQVDQYPPTMLYYIASLIYQEVEISYYVIFHTNQVQKIHYLCRW